MNGAEQLLHNLGVARPEDIDLEAIAHLLGVKIRYLPLDGCEARITGNGDRAVIAVNSRSSIERQRFSIGHELGHWAYHRNRVLICKAAEVIGTGWSIIAALGRNKLLSRIGSQKTLFTRSSVDLFASSYMLGGEILERTSAFPPYGLRRGFADLGVEPVAELKEKATLIYNRQEALQVLVRLEAVQRRDANRCASASNVHPA